MATNEQAIDFLILQKIKELQESQQFVLGGQLYQSLSSSPDFRGDDGQVLPKLLFGNRMTILLDGNFITLQPGKRTDLRSEHLMFGATITAAGEAALARGPENLMKDESIVANQFNIANLNAGQVQVGDGNAQHVQLKMEIKVEDLVKAAITAIEESELPPDEKAKAKSAFEHLQAGLSMAAQTCTLGLTAAKVFFGG